MKNLLLSCAAAALLVGSLQAQTVYLTENFDTAVPPAGWTHDQVNTMTQGWIQSADLRAWHEDEFSSLGTADDTLWTSVDLTTATVAYLHVDMEVNFAIYQANHPNSFGDGITEIVMRPAGSTTWTPIWTDCRTLNRRDMMTVQIPAAMLGGMAEIGIRYYGTYAHEVWVDLFQVDDSTTSPPLPPPPPTVWTYMNLPASTAVAPYTQDFEAGSAPAEMALTALDWATLGPDPEAWCTIANTMGTNGGSFCLEMGLDPVSTNYHDVLNAMVLSLDLSGLANPQVTFAVVDWGEETDPEDGIWVSNDGSNWHQVLDNWGQFGSTWQTVTVDLSGAPVNFLQPVYLMFAQQDNFPYGNLDGVGIDDIVVDSGSGGGGVSPTLTVTTSGVCPGPVTFEVENTTPGGMVVLLYGAAGSFTSTGPCAGTVVDIAAPNVGYVWGVSSGSIDCFNVPNLPAAGCGLTVQAVDVASCTPSNSVVL